MILGLTLSSYALVGLQWVLSRMHLVPPPQGFSGWGGVAVTVMGALSVGAYLWAFVHVYRRRLPRATLLAIVFWLILGTGVLQLLHGPVAAATSSEEFAAGFEAGRAGVEAGRRAAAEAKAAKDPAGAPAAEPGAPEREVVSESVNPVGADVPLAVKFEGVSASQVGMVLVAITGLLSLFAKHFFACLFLPWRPGESMRPMWPLLGLNAVITAWYFRAAPMSGVAIIAGSPLVVLPGVAVCWWRFSRFHEKFHVRMLKGRYGELKQELASARQIHEAMFPAPVAEGPVRFSYRYEPMRQIGGDYLYARVADTSGPAGPILNLVILDVTGHGISAALTVNRLHGEIDRLFGEDPSTGPGRLLVGLNAYLHHTLARHSMYATALCMRFDPADGTVRWASAGHPPAFLRSVGGTVHPIDSTTLVLGACLGEDFVPNEQCTRFGPGDTLIAYTDGVIETRNAHGRMLRVDGLLRLIAGGHPDPEGWAPAILREVDRFRFGPIQDDTLVVEIYRPLDGVLGASAGRGVSRPHPAAS
ncbi:MAG: serine/threonine-protein phosphatase [Phycisphaerales bacterium]|nr:serine/threonine-protein phosphatase [Phycisphaerales bacterium]